MVGIRSTAHKILVIGGSGYVGRRVVAALEVHGGGDGAVWTASRSPAPGRWVRLDLNEPATFSMLDDFCVVVDCAASSQAPPDPLIAHCLAAGLRLVEASGDPEMIERNAPAARPDVRPGTVVLGMGLFPGLSNLVARELIRSLPACDGVDLAIRLNPFSGAGRGVVDLMTRLLVSDVVRYAGGARQVGRPLVAGPAMRFADGVAGTLAIGLPEPQMLHWSAGVATAAGWLSPHPRPLRLPLSLAGRLARGAQHEGLLVGAMQQSLYALRGRLLRWRATPVELLAEAWGGGERRALSLVVQDGMTATAQSLAAAARLLLHQRPAPGVLLPDEAFGLHEILQAAGACEPDWRLLSL